jgi:perosamine synthetase
MHERPVFQDRRLFSNDQHPVADRVDRQGLYLPSGLVLSEDQLSAVCDAVHEALLIQQIQAS